MFLKFNQKIAILSSMPLIFLPVVGIVTLPHFSALAQNGICACASSEAQPQRGQRNRSSGNFSTQGCTTTLSWNAPKGVSFNVMRDVSGGRDPVELSNVARGTRTQNPNQRSLYIANPKGARGGFRVCARNT
ncbi:hypothetical protein [[Phormidium] sp. LEGE 05292]|uniref:hypothetical protein n=1 Tax=[Phormidium] sp. LEGE 05292 TaxID=767427 RepID=UPI001D15392C|nr:hypothetical protein [Phormidium sp. LEGE 05292]